MQTSRSRDRDYLRAALVGACALLAETENSVSEVAYETGFGSLSHFFRVFHQAYGCTPRDYRRQIQTAQSAEKL